jgi:DHA2 family multidrug resistance protein
MSRTRAGKGRCAAAERREEGMSPERQDDVAIPTEHLVLVTAGTMLATIMQAIDTTIANVALPHMQGSFSATLDEIAWVLTSYIIAAAIMTPPTGWLAARFGRKRLFLVSVAGFTAASVLCGIAGSLGQMVAFRLLQGAFGAALVPLSQAVLLDSYPRSKHGQAMAIWGLGVMVGPILGPTLGGWLTDNYSWRWVFYINVPFGILAFLTISTFVTETKRNRGLPFDMIGFATISLALGAFQLFLDRGEIKDWFGSTEILIEIVAACAFFYVFLVHTFTTDNPFIRPSLFRDRNFSVSLVLMTLVGVLLFGSLALLPPLLQSVLNYPVVTTGFVIAPRGIGTAVAMVLVGRAMGRIDTRLLLTFGLVTLAISMFWVASFSLEVGMRDIVMSGIVQGIGFGFIWVPVSTIAFSTLPTQRRTEAAGIFSLMRNIGASAGISIVTALIVRNTQINHEQIGAVINAYNPLLRLPAIRHFWDVHTATGAMALNEEITRQATMIAYLDDFKLMAILSVMALPLILLVSSTKPAAAAPSKPAHSAAMD